jgi:hypothetical protein
LPFPISPLTFPLILESFLLDNKTKKDLKESQVIKKYKKNVNNELRKVDICDIKSADKNG